MNVAHAFIVKVKTPERTITRIPIAENSIKAIITACDKIPDDTVVLRLSCKPVALSETFPCAA